MLCGSFMCHYYLEHTWYQNQEGEWWQRQDPKYVYQGEHTIIKPSRQLNFSVATPQSLSGALSALGAPDPTPPLAPHLATLANSLFHVNFFGSPCRTFSATTILRPSTI